MEDLIESVVYSGSFNPFHIGHLEIVKHLSKRFHKVYLVVSVQNPLKTNGTDNFNDRLENVKQIIKKTGLTNVFVEDIEITLQPPYYTINTLEALDAKYPHELLSLCVGGDCMKEFHKWYRWEDILDSYGVIVIPRKGYSIHLSIDLLKKQADEPEYWHLCVLEADIPEVSSSEIREKINNGEDVVHLLP
jgi:nicotinate-nucleotide adenylyltransferase